MVKSYAIVVSNLKAFADAHLEIKRFKASFLSQIEPFAAEDRTFPILYATPSSVQNKRYTNTYSFTLRCIDKLNNNQDNEIAILNSTEQILRDLAVWLKESQNGLELENEPLFQPLENYLFDGFIGWEATFDFSGPAFSNECSIPFVDGFLVEYPNGNCDAVYHTKYLTCETLIDCETIQDILTNVSLSITGATQNGQNIPVIDKKIALLDTYVTGVTTDTDGNLIIKQNNNKPDLSVKLNDFDNITATTISVSSITATTISATTFNGNGANLTGVVHSVGLSMPNAFNVANSPITDNGTLVVTATGTTNNFIDGTGNLQLNSNLTLCNNPNTLNNGILRRGTIVYVSGSTGNRPAITRAIASGETTSSRTYGVVLDDIAVNADGYVLTFGQITDLDTRNNATYPFTTDTLVDGDILYLSPTNAGYVTNIKPSAPNHIVYIGNVIRTHPTQGNIDYRIQNGWELNELHNVKINGVANRDILQYNSSNQLWENKNSPIFTSLSAGTISATTFVGLPLDIYTTGATLSGGVATFTNTTGGTFTLTGFPDAFTTGFTYNNANTFSLQRNQGQSPLTATINTMTGLTINGRLVVNTGATITNNTIRENALTVNVTRSDTATTFSNINERLIQVTGNRTLLTPTGQTFTVYGLQLTNSVTFNNSGNPNNSYGIYQDGTLSNLVSSSAHYWNKVAGSLSVSGDNITIGGFDYTPTVSRTAQAIGTSVNFPVFGFRNGATYNSSGADGSTLGYIDNPTMNFRTVTNYSFWSKPIYNLSSGSNIVYGFYGQPTFNGPNAGSLDLKGFYWNPSLSVAGASLTHNAIETVRGNVVIGTTSGNVLIGTATDAGFRLDVSGLTRNILGGANNTSTNIATITNNISTNASTQTYSSQIFNGTFTDNNTGNNTIIRYVNIAPNLKIGQANSSSTNYSLFTISPAYQGTSGSTYFYDDLSGGYINNLIYLAPTYDSNVVQSNLTHILMRYTSNALSVGASTVRGIYYAPITTSGTHIAFENTVGNNYFNSSAGSTIIGSNTNAGFKFDVNGTTRLQSSISFATTTVTGNTTLGGNYTVRVNASGGTRTMTLPTATATTAVGRVYIIKKIDNSANAVTVTTTNNELIDGVTGYTLTSQYKYVQVQGNGTGWDIIGNN